MATNPFRFSHDIIFAESARRFADRAFASHEQSDWDGFVVCASTAIELLTKAVLAKVNLLLIASERSDERLMELARSNPRKGVPASVRTISAEVALRRAKLIGVRFDRYEKDLKALREARNSIVHSGSSSPLEDSAHSFDAWIRSMVALARHAAYPMSLVFGSNAELVEVQMKAYADQLEALSAQRIAAARRRWKDERVGFTSMAIERRREAIHSQLVGVNRADPSVQWIECPVCTLPAQVFGELEAEADWDYADGESYIAGIYHRFEPTGVHCQTCGLNLDSRGLVEKSAVLKQWEFPPRWP